jgi:hypothetical protein
LTFPTESHAHRYFAPDRFLLRQAEATDSAVDLHPTYPGVIFRQFDVRDLDVSWCEYRTSPDTAVASQVMIRA